MRLSSDVIIPYQEPPGNYNFVVQLATDFKIIPYQEPPGNYNLSAVVVLAEPIIPYQEPPGNYNIILYHSLTYMIIPYVSGNIISYSKNLNISKEALIKSISS